MFLEPTPVWHSRRLPAVLGRLPLRRRQLTSNQRLEPQPLANSLTELTSKVLIEPGFPVFAVVPGLALASGAGKFFMPVTAIVCPTCSVSLAVSPANWYMVPDLSVNV